MHAPTLHGVRMLSVLLAALAALALPAAAGANASLKVGFLDNAYSEQNPGAFWQDLADLNVGFMRWDVQWKVIAPERPDEERNPADPAYHWGATDAFVIGAAEHGLQDRVMFTVWRTPDWAAAVRNRGALEAQMPRVAAWRNFVAAAALRYSGTYIPPGATQPLPRVVSWETWNEPNAYFAFRPQFMHGRAVAPRNYATLLAALRREVNAVMPFKPTFVAGAMYKQGGPKSMTPLDFLRGLHAARARFDVLSMHPYNSRPGLGLQDGVSQSTTNPRFIGVGNFQTFISAANQIFRHRYPIWVTEFGWATQTPGKTQFVTTFAKQARFAAQAIASFRRMPQVERLSWFLIRDMPYKPVGAWYTTGLRRADDARKPSFGSWQRATEGLE